MFPALTDCSIFHRREDWAGEYSGEIGSHVLDTLELIDTEVVFDMILEVVVVLWTKLFVATEEH